MVLTIFKLVPSLNIHTSPVIFIACLLLFSSPQFVYYDVSYSVL